MWKGGRRLDGSGAAATMRRSTALKEGKAVSLKENGRQLVDVGNKIQRLNIDLRNLM
jgi:hypothetical protein